LLPAQRWLGWRRPVRSPDEAVDRSRVRHEYDSAGLESDRESQRCLHWSGCCGPYRCARWRGDYVCFTSGCSRDQRTRFSAGCRDGARVVRASRRTCSRRSCARTSAGTASCRRGTSACATGRSSGARTGSADSGTVAN
jgi:hypothetical protein